MIDRADYLALVRARPELFRNPEGAAFVILLDEAEIRQAEAHVAGLLAKVGAPKEWAEVGIAFRDQYVLLLRDAVRFADGSLGTYIRMVAPENSFQGVAILPVWQRQVLLIRHFRHATRAWHLEVPRGFGSDPDTEVPPDASWPRKSEHRKQSSRTLAKPTRTLAPIALPSPCITPKSARTARRSFMKASPQSFRPR